MTMEQYTPDQIGTVIMQGLQSVYGGEGSINHYGGNLYTFSFPEDGIDVDIFSRNVNSTSRSIAGELRGQFSVSDKIREPLTRLSKEQRITIPLFLEKDKEQFMAGDPEHFTKQIPNCLENWTLQGKPRQVSVAYSRKEVSDQCVKYGVAVRKYQKPKNRQLVVHFKYDYLGWYLDNWKRIHNIDFENDTDNELTQKYSNEAKTFLENNPISKADSSQSTTDDVSKSKSGKYGRGGESPRHKYLKFLVGHSPKDFGLTRDAQNHIDQGEARFITKDRVDVLFLGGGKKATVIEVELEDQQKVLEGVHQAVKYRALAAARDNYPGPFDFDSAYSGAVIAYEVDYPKVISACKDLKINLYRFDDESKTISQIKLF